MTSYSGIKKRKSKCRHLPPFALYADSVNPLLYVLWYLNKKINYNDQNNLQ